MVYGDDPCPVEEGGGIVVCARKPESERYRIPKDLRQKKEFIGSQGWGSRVQTMEASGRQLLPNSCTAIGSNGRHRRTSPQGAGAHSNASSGWGDAMDMIVLGSMPRL